MLDPILIDPAAFARERQSLEGEVALADLHERVAAHEYLASNEAKVAFRLQGGVDRWQRPYLDLAVSADLPLVCQRCLQPMSVALDEQAHIVLFADEAALDEAMLADDELEGMLLSPELDVAELLEDQLLMALPYSPRHEDCSNQALADINQNSKPNPFAVLAGLKNSR